MDCPNCLAELEEIGPNTYYCPNCDEEWDIDELTELEDYQNGLDGGEEI